MTVKTILSEKGRTVITERPSAKLIDVCQTLAKHKIGAVVLVEDGDRIAGILSERDVVRALSQEGSAALDRPAATYMSAKVVTAHEEDTIDEVMGRMSQGRFRHMPITRNGKLIGVVSIGDVVKRKIEHAEREANEIRNYIATA